MGSRNKQPSPNKAPIADDVSHPPFETKALRHSLKELLDQPFHDPVRNRKVKIGSYTFGVYVFYDYDGEPIYVGQTREKLSTRVRRHLTNQRTDAVAMSVLDPFEVCDVEFYPLPEFEGSAKTDAKVVRALNDLEATVYFRVLRQSAFGAVLNEKIPYSTKRVRVPTAVRGRLVSDAVMEVKSHPDLRIARRAATLARLAQIISERKVAPGLRRVLVVQAKRLQALATRRYKHFEGMKDDEPDEDAE